MPIVLAPPAADRGVGSHTVQRVRGLDELIDRDDPAWPLVDGWLRAAPHPVEVVPAERPAAERTLLWLQVTTHSLLGALAYQTGGVLVDDGWLRLLGSPSPRVPCGLVEWNQLDGQASPLAGALIVAHDVLGGVFAVNGGAPFDRAAHVHYFAPDRLAWESLEVAYSSFVAWAFTAAVADFYRPWRWPGWRHDVAGLSTDHGLMSAPPPWTIEGKDPTRVRRAPVPMRELWQLQRDLARQLDGA